MKRKIRKLIENKLGYWFYKSKHLPVGTDLFVDLNYKIEQPIQVVFDIGANIGAFTNDFKTEYPDSKIYSFEPFKNTFEVLLNNTSNLQNVECFQIAIGDKIEQVEIQLKVDDCSPQNSLLNKATNSNNKNEIIEVTTIDAFVNENKITEIDLLKIDTEGYEEQVLLGASDAISSGKIKMIYLEVGFSKVNKGNSNFIILYQKLEELNFSFYGLYEISQIGISANLHYGNALFIHSSVLSKLENWQLR